jgi:hypothetical protein
MERLARAKRLKENLHNARLDENIGGTLGGKKLKVGPIDNFTAKVKC